jgi:putative NIF3 family GTP cyclohydrolase 1 type 2
LPKLEEIYQSINRFAPWDLAEDWDHSGLQIGEPGRLVHKILIAVDFNQTVFEEGLFIR